MSEFSLDGLIETYENKKTIFSVMIELCTVCNWNCEYCYIDTHDNYGLELYEIKSFLHEVRMIGCFQVTFTGGEIFLRKDIWEIIEYSRQLGFEVLLYTNFSVLDDKDINRLKVLNVALVSCSLFSLNEKINSNFVRFNRSVEIVKRNLLFAKKIGLNVELKVMLMNFNYTSKESIIKFCEENNINLKFDYIIFPKRKQCSEMNEFYLSKDNLKEVVKLDDLQHNKTFNSKDSYICSSTRTSLFIDSKGDVFPCLNLDINIGNIKKNSLFEIWDNRKLKFIQNLKKSSNKCLLCNKNKYCQKCIGLSLRENGKIDSCNKINEAIASIRKEIYEEK